MQETLHVAAIQANLIWEQPEDNKGTFDQIIGWGKDSNILFDAYRSDSLSFYFDGTIVHRP